MKCMESQKTTPYTRMTHILILGDSWGSPQGYGTHIEPQKHTHTILQGLGHTVTNCSIPGGSNLESFARARALRIRPDVVIWFHSESLRDLHPRPSVRFSIPKETEKMARVIYKKYRHLLKSMGRPCDIIVGGQAPVYEHMLEHTPKAIVRDWRCELLGIDSIPSHSVCHIDLFENRRCIDSPQQKLEWTRQNEQIVDMERESSLFPDNAHPGTIAHLELCRTVIVPTIQKYVNNA